LNANADLRPHRQTGNGLELMFDCAQNYLDGRPAPTIWLSPVDMDYYVILGIPRTADATAIRTAFRGLVRRHHPDAGAGSSASRFREIVEAYETLHDPKRRRDYDASLRPAVGPRWVEPLIAVRPEPLFRSRRPYSSVVAEDLWSDRQRQFEDFFRVFERLFCDF
jgi:curved DNA-binding protein CbpA